MKDILYLCCDQTKIARTTKSMPNVRAGEIVVKVEVEVDRQAFREPTLVRQVHVSDWRDGIDVGADIELRQNFITEAEAEMIRRNRLDQMQTILAGHGYKIEPPEADDDHQPEPR
jgi:hypothetical protein